MMALEKMGYEYDTIHHELFGYATEKEPEPIVTKVISRFTTLASAMLFDAETNRLIGMEPAQIAEVMDTMGLADVGRFFAGMVKALRDAYTKANRVSEPGETQGTAPAKAAA